MKKLIVYDLDGTLAESKSALDPKMSGLLHNLLGIVKVADYFRRRLAPVRKAGTLPSSP